MDASNLAAWQLTKALWRSDVHDWERFSVVHLRYNAVYRELVASLLAVSHNWDGGVCGPFPFADGFLTGKYDRDADMMAGSRANLNERFLEFDEESSRHSQSSGRSQPE